MPVDYRGVEENLIEVYRFIFDARLYPFCREIYKSN